EPTTPLSGAHVRPRAASWWGDISRRLPASCVGTPSNSVRKSRKRASWYAQEPRAQSDGRMRQPADSSTPLSREWPALASAGSPLTLWEITRLLRSHQKPASSSRSALCSSSAFTTASYVFEVSGSRIPPSSSPSPSERLKSMAAGLKVFLLLPEKAVWSSALCPAAPQQPHPPPRR